MADPIELQERFGEMPELKPSIWDGFGPITAADLDGFSDATLEEFEGAKNGQ